MHTADDTRYSHMKYNHCSRSGLKLPEVSLGLWQNFGDSSPFETMRAIIRRAFDRGVSHFDLANNYGPPPGAAEENFGRIMGKDFRRFRDEMIVSTKAGYLMWPGPYGEGGSRKHLLSSLDQSLKRMKIDYVDIFYSHRLDPTTPLEETMAALATAVRQGKALYIGISSYSAAMTRKASAILNEMGIPCVLHQPSYSMLNRWIEAELLDTLEELGIGCIVFSPLAQGLLSDKYLNGTPANSRATRGGPFRDGFINTETLKKVAALNGIAQRRGQTLAQMAISWVLRDPRVTSALIGARTVEQLDNALDALKNRGFTAEELTEIDRYATDAEINIWQTSSTGVNSL